jgi:hypothetical protein
MGVDGLTARERIERKDSKYWKRLPTTAEGRGWPARGRTATTTGRGNHTNGHELDSPKKAQNAQKEDEPRMKTDERGLGPRVGKNEPRKARKTLNVSRLWKRLPTDYTNGHELDSRKKAQNAQKGN